MTRVVIDTSVLVSGLWTEHGAEASVLGLIIAGKLIWCVSEDVLAEYEAVLSRHNFRHVERRKIFAVLAMARPDR